MVVIVPRFYVHPLNVQACGSVAPVPGAAQSASLREHGQQDTQNIVSGF